MILPNVRLGLRHKSRKHARPVGGAQKGRKEKSHHCGECGTIQVVGRCFARKRLRAMRSKSGLSVGDALPDHGHTNCSPERPKQNFLPTLTSWTRQLTPDVGCAGSRSCSSPMPTASSAAGLTLNGSIKASRIASARR